MTSPTSTPEPVGLECFRTVPPPQAAAEEDPIGPFNAMRKFAAALTDRLEFGAPIQPCARPYVEVCVLDDENLPLADVPYRLLIGGVLFAEGVLDGSGFARIEGHELPDQQWQVEVVLHRHPTELTVQRVDVEVGLAFVAQSVADPDDPLELQAWLPSIAAPYL